ncbi:type II toxin-antitoxin system HicB family antitoxin [Pseudocalidococcus azoricus]|uniref:type II toxin-antitoxin system HicB family antitoxin n=1 Tax=Pseudocalidococcus azoricus TaxID=3110322 RepID=UPI002AF6AB69|nr:type II toxin-antitoxin system HicB family antitoxin [Pseudocalidococcus azoricus]
MKQEFTVGIWQEGNWYVAQCLEIDLASQGRTESEALANIQEAIELFLEPPTPEIKPYPDLFLENIGRICRLEFSHGNHAGDKTHENR